MEPESQMSRCVCRVHCQITRFKHDETAPGLSDSGKNNSYTNCRRMSIFWFDLIHCFMSCVTDRHEEMHDNYDHYYTATVNIIYTLVTNNDYFSDTKIGQSLEKVRKLKNKTQQYLLHLCQKMHACLCELAESTSLHLCRFAYSTIILIYIYTTNNIKNNND